MHKSSGSLGMSKHRTSGHAVNSKHFTGTKGGGLKKTRRIGKGLSRVERSLKRGSHVNKYARKAG